MFKSKGPRLADNLGGMTRRGLQSTLQGEGYKCWISSIPPGWLPSLQNLLLYFPITARLRERRVAALHARGRLE